MKKSLILLLLLFSMNHLFAQSEKAAYKTASTAFVTNFNKSDYDAIFQQFSPEMQKALPIDQAKDFFSKLARAGKITKLEFIKNDQLTYYLYKTSFERATLAIHISVDESGKINGFFAKGYTDDSLPKMQRNTTKLSLPFKGEWTVFWGGDTKELNYHVESEAQKNAFDIVITDAKGNSYKTDGKTNEDYYAFGKELYAPCDGEVALVVNGVKDNKPGESNPIVVPGNCVIIKTANNEYLFFAHFKHNSIVVKEGQKLKQGDLLGLCGNTGNSSEPHLHFHIQNVEDMNVATGVKCYFDQLKVNGVLKTDYSPIKGEKISSN